MGECALEWRNRYLNPLHHIVTWLSWLTFWSQSPVSQTSHYSLSTVMVVPITDWHIYLCSLVRFQCSWSFLCAARTAPYHSWRNPAERIRVSYRIFCWGGNFFGITNQPRPLPPGKFVLLHVKQLPWFGNWWVVTAFMYLCDHPNFVFKPCTSHVNNSCHCKLRCC